MSDKTSLPRSTGSCCGTGKSLPETPAESCGCFGQTERQTAPAIRQTTSEITAKNRLDHFLARWGVNRAGHIVPPGLYRLGNPDKNSPVFASANYTLSFDALRSALAGRDAWILVINTKGINVWCAAGKGTFGTGELIRRIAVTGLADVVAHRKIILPQLGAPGVCAHDVARYSGFSVEYGPVRAADLPSYLAAHTATPEMRTVRFDFIDRLILAPMELVHFGFYGIIAAVVLFFLAGPVAALAAISAVLAGTVLFPALLPVLPSKDFSLKGFFLGAVVAIPFAVVFAGSPGLSGILQIIAALVPFLTIPPVVAYLGLNFTGSTTFTSRTGVKKEIFRYIPAMVVLAGLGTILGIALGVLRLLGVA